MTVAPLSPGTMQKVYAHAMVCYPRECCGFVHHDDAHPCHNVQDELHGRDPMLHPRTALTAYAMAPDDVARIIDAVGQGSGLTVVYHSHPDVGAYFSETDREAALALSSGMPLERIAHLVVDVRSDGVRGATLFEFDGSDFRPAMVVKHHGGEAAPAQAAGRSARLLTGRPVI